MQSENIKNNAWIWAVVAALIGGICLIAVGLWVLNKNNANQETIGGNTNTEVTEEITESTETENPQDEVVDEVVQERQKIHLMMLGDNLMHLSVVKSGYQADGSRNYDFLFEPVKAYLEKADIKITNQETILGGETIGFSAYPRFNSPTELGDAIAKAGFNVVLHASNHAADKGMEAMNICMDFWSQYPEIQMLGIFKEVDEPDQDIGLLTIDGVTFAFLNYTYSPNLAALPTWLQGHLGMLCDWDKKTGTIDFKKLHPDVLTDIARAKELADVVVVCPHWGNEYTFVPTVYQKQFAQQMTEAGADLIIGTHPHVIQPVEWVKADNGNKALCYYSLGNFVSAQAKPETMLEAMAWVTFEVDGDSVKILEEETGAIPMVYQYNDYYRYVNLYFLDDYTEELAKAHGMQIKSSDEFSYALLEKWANQVLGNWRLNSKDVLEEKVNLDMWR